MSYVEHDIVGSPMFDKGSQLVLDIFRLLSGKAGYGVVAIEALGRYAVTIFAVADFALQISRKAGSVLCANRAG